MNLVERAKAIWKLFTSGSMTRTDKIILVLSLVYCLSPLDIIPDVVPVIGFLDDLVVVLAALRHFSRTPAVDDTGAIQVDAKVV